MKLPDWLHRQSETLPDHLALIAPEGRWSFRQLEGLVAGTARWLQRQGVKPGQRLGLLLKNGAAFAALIYAAGRVGAVIVPFNSRLTPVELRRQGALGGVNFLLYDEAHEAQARAAAGGEERKLVPVNFLGLMAEAAPFSPADPGGHRENIPSVNLEATHTIMFTAGTTGDPKGARLTYGNHWWSAVASSLNLGHQRGDRWLVCLPLFHVGGMSILMRTVIYGITAVVQDGFSPRKVNAAIHEEKVTLLSVVADMLRRLLADQGDRPYPKHLRCILVGGGPVPRSLLAECARRNLPVVQTYGLTETASQLATLSPADAMRKLGSAGKPLLPNELRIAPLAGSSGGNPPGDTLPPGQVGEIVVRGPSVTPGYFRRPDATAAVLRQGWLHTGDIGYLDEEGFLYVLDRRDDLIISGGENVYPAEIEAVLVSHPEVLEAGVTALPHHRWGQVPAAVVVPADETLRTTVGPSATAAQKAFVEEMQNFCSQRLAAYKVPVKFRLAPALPRNAAGKLLRRKLGDFLKGENNPRHRRRS